MDNVGTDIIEVARIEKLIKEKGNKFLNKIYTQKEIDYCESKGPNKYQHYAGRFAAKEAIIKAWQGPQGAINMKKIEITNTRGGKPVALLDCNPAFYESIQISISHIKDYATATALIDNGVHIRYY